MDNAGPKAEIHHIEDTADEEKKMVRKMDWHIMPIVVALYLMSFLDRVNIGMSEQTSNVQVF